MAEELLLIIIKEFMKASGWMIKGMEWGLKDSQMVIFMKVNTKKVKSMVKVNIHGLMENTMMVNGLMVKNKDMELGKIMKMNSIADSGLEISRMDLESIFGRMAMYLKVNGKHVWDMEKVAINSVLEILMLENINLEKPKAMDSMLGAMEIFI